MSRFFFFGSGTVNLLPIELTCINFRSQNERETFNMFPGFFFSLAHCATTEFLNVEESEEQKKNIVETRCAIGDNIRIHRPSELCCTTSIRLRELANDGNGKLIKFQLSGGPFVAAIYGVNVWNFKW